MELFPEIRGRIVATTNYALATLYGVEMWKVRPMTTIVHVAPPTRKLLTPD